MDLPQNINPQDLTFEKVWLLFKETDKKIEQVAKTVAATSAKVDRLAEIYGGFMNNVARTAESFYYETLNNILDQKDVLTINGFEFYHILKNVTLGRKKKRREFDIVLVNPQQKVIALFEIKMNMRLIDVEKFVETAEEYVRTDRAFYDYKLILGIGAFTYEEGVVERAKEYGLVILKPNFHDNSVIFENTEPGNIRIFEPK